ncbi:methyltransferase [Streptomyces longispororuber]|uniref:Methyltransferase n=1 Tax=Streptomyces longispororuber TaxID=68230 RepID=A0A919DJG1_9ACTN|nr:methyltransferase [Streptomyces longispororuber]
MARSLTTDAPPAAPVPPARMWRLPGVYAPQADTRLLARALQREGVAGLDVLDVGSGSGALSVYAAHFGARVTAVDVSRRAVWTTRFNAWRAGRRLTALHGSLDTLEGRRFDVLVSNPPYVPAPNPNPPARGAARAWDAGYDGRHVIDRICAAAPRLLRPHGVFLMVHSALSGTETTLMRLEEAGLRARVSERALIPHGPVLRSRQEWLRARNLIGPDETLEGLVVIRAELR